MRTSNHILRHATEMVLMCSMRYFGFAGGIR